MKVLRIDEYYGKTTVPNIMYRNPDYGGSGESDAASVLKFEIGELKNTDILDYCMDYYSLSEGLVQDIEWVADNIDDIECNDDMLDKTVRKLISEVSMECGVKIKHCLWLAELENVYDFYDGNEGVVEAYRTSNAVLSDLGDDGMLFGYSEKPEAIEDK